MLGLVGLQIANTAPLFTTRAADHLVQQVKCTLGGTRVAVTQPKIGVNDPDQVELWKVMTLCDELGADDEIKAALRHVVELLPEALDRFHEIARQHKGPRLRKKFAGLLLKPFDPRANSSETIRRMTVGALRRRRPGKPAVMTNQTTFEAVIDQPGITVGTLQTEAAGTAQRQRCVPAAIENKQGLIPAGQRNHNSLG